MREVPSSILGMPPFSKNSFFPSFLTWLTCRFTSFFPSRSQMHLAHQSVQCLVVSVPPRIRFHDSRPCCDLLSKAQHDERIPKRGPHRQHSEIATTGHHGKLAIATDCSLKCSTSVSADEDGGPHRQHSEITSTGHHGSSSATPPLQPSCVFSRQWKQP